LSNLDVREVVNALPAKQKEAVLLREKGYKVKEIAVIQKVSEGTVKSRLNYARKKVNAYIEAQVAPIINQNELHID
jgi:RNA polymerase sigma factor (sigma-70 family)